MAKKSKLKKSKDNSICCKRCIFFNNQNKESCTCSLDGREVEANDVCKSFDNTTTEECARCHRKVTYKNRDEYHNAIIHFSMDSGSGSSSGQNIHLCRKCETEMFLKFQDFIDSIREFVPDEKEKDKERRTDDRQD